MLYVRKFHALTREVVKQILNICLFQNKKFKDLYLYICTYILLRSFITFGKAENFSDHIPMYVHTYNILVTVFDSQLAIYDPTIVKKIYAQQKMIPR